MIERWDIETENIIDSHKLYFRVFKDNINYSNLGTDKNKIKPKAFFNTPKDGQNMSTDWEEYSTPQETLDFVSRQYKTGKTAFKDKTQFSVVSFTVEDVKFIDSNHKVIHDPVQYFPEVIGKPNNRAHTLIDSKISDEKADSLEIRALFVEKARFEILQY